jgi:hypothetical protein
MCSYELQVSARGDFFDVEMSKTILLWCGIPTLSHIQDSLHIPVLEMTFLYFRVPSIRLWIQKTEGSKGSLSKLDFTVCSFTAFMALLKRYAYMKVITNQSCSSLLKNNNFAMILFVHFLSVNHHPSPIYLCSCLSSFKLDNMSKQLSGVCCCQ